MKGMIHNDILIAVTFKQAPLPQGEKKKKRKLKKKPSKSGFW